MLRFVPANAINASIMTFKCFGLALTFFCSVSVLFLESRGYTQEKLHDPAYKDDALVAERFDVDIRFAADGTGERTSHALMHAQNEAGARALNVLSISYASANQKAEITGVRVHKPDGSTVETPSTNAIETPSPVTRQAPLYSDLKEIQLPIRSFNAGDTLEYTFRLTTKQAQAPDQFWGAENLLTGMVFLSQTITLHVPSTKYVNVWSPEHKPEITESNGEKTYHWSTQLLEPAAVQAKKAAEKEDDKLPDIAWTTFHNWAEIGAWYRSLAKERADPTPELKARAEALTKDAQTPEAKISALYSYVATHTRYIGVDLGIGRYQPHAAAVVLANQYGDCKDKDTLLEALLQSVGFTTAPALIGANIDLAPEVPSPAFFNHVITTVQLPSGQIWLDTTPETSPYRFLMEPLRGKQALMIPATGEAHLEKTPAEPPFPQHWEFIAEGTIDADNGMDAQVTTHLRGDAEVAMRTVIRNISPGQWDEATQSIVRMWGFGGTTSHSFFSKPEETDNPFEMRWEYKRSPYGDTDAHRIVPLFPYVILPAIDEKDPPKKSIDLDQPRTETAVSRITLPRGYSVELPDAIHVQAPFATFDKTYHFENGVITIERRIAVLQQKIPKSDWKKYLDFTQKASFANEAWITLLPPKGAKPAPPTSQADSSVKDLLQAASLQIRSRDLDGAEKLLKQAQEKDPTATDLFYWWAVLHMGRGKPDLTKADLQKAIELHPEEANSAMWLSTLQMKDDKAAARKTLAALAAQRRKEDFIIHRLPALQIQAEDLEGAIATLNDEIASAPTDSSLRAELADVLLKTGDKAGAVSAAQKALALSETPQDRNGAAYLFAEAGGDLHLAEFESRRAVDDLEAASATIDISSVNQNAFASTYTLLASWDTLAWILFQQGKIEEAKSYLEASWANMKDPEVAYHLAHVIEKTNRQAAMDLYGQALAAKAGQKSKELEKNIHADIDRLKANGVHDTSLHASADNQKERTFHPTLAHKIVGYATFRLQIDKNGIVAAQWMSGEEKMRDLAPDIKSIKLNQLVPPQSKGRILRDGILSCHSSPQCDFVLMPDSGIAQEHIE